MDRPTNWRRRLAVSADIATIGLLLVVAIVLVGRFVRPAQTGDTGPTELPPQTTIALGAIPLMGSAAADTVVIEFSDFECPYCRQHATGVLHKLKAEFVEPGQIRYGFANHPLDGIHNRARYLAMAGLCAARQGQFWGLHHVLFSRKISSDDDLGMILGPLKIDTPEFLDCMSQGSSLETEIARQLEIVRGLGIVGTPSFVVGRMNQPGQLDAVMLLRGLQSIDRFRQVIADVRNRPQ